MRYLYFLSIDYVFNSRTILFIILFDLFDLINLKVGPHFLFFFSLETERRALETERRALETERRALETERRALETERRVLETERRVLETERRVLETERGVLERMMKWERRMMKRKAGCPSFPSQGGPLGVRQAMLALSTRQEKRWSKCWLRRGGGEGDGRSEVAGASWVTLGTSDTPSHPVTEVRAATSRCLPNLVDDLQ